MNRSSPPKKQPVPFGTNGQRENLLEDTPAGDNTASYSKGFPPVTMILKAAGGLPPKGQDMNQILFELSDLMRWASTGAINSFDPAFSSAIGGYPSGALVLSDAGDKIFISVIDNNTDNPNSTNTGSWKNAADFIGVSESVQQEIDGKLAKDQNGADIPDKNQFIKNLGFLELTINTLYPVGIVAFFAQNKNPNTLFPGTTWKYIGENRTVRLASANGNDVMTTGGSDSVKLAVGNLPAHTHTFSANTSSFDYGTKTTNSAGAHTHDLLTDRNDTGEYHSRGSVYGHVGNGYKPVVNSGSSWIASSGAHTHSVPIGAHSHSVSGTTDNTGSGTAINVTNSYIKLMGWYRSA